LRIPRRISFYYNANIGSRDDLPVVYRRYSSSGLALEEVRIGRASFDDGVISVHFEKYISADIEAVLEETEVLLSRHSMSLSSGKTAYKIAFIDSPQYWYGYGSFKNQMLKFRDILINSKIGDFLG